MAWFPEAERLELQPESDDQPAIVPTQVIFHSVAAPWDENRIGAYWAQPGVNLESHFGVDFDGSCGQYIGTQTRADANYGANRRADGTGAISVESASNTNHSDPWTPEQIQKLTALGARAHAVHGIPLRICRTHDDPGFGYHGLFPQWSPSGTACPGPARIKQFREVVFPGIVARATGQTIPEEDDMPYTPEQLGSALANAMLPQYDASGNVIGEAPLYLFIGGFDLAHQRHDRDLTEVKARQAATEAVLRTLLDRAGVDTAAIVAAIDAAVSQTVERELREGTVSVDVNVHGNAG